MPRTTLTKSTAPGSYASAAVAVTMTAADTSNLNQFRCGGDDLLIIHNTGGSEYTFTITSVADPIFRRLGTITTEAIAAGAIKVFGPMKPDGWVQSDGYIYCQANNAAVKFGVVAGFV
jgi:hypothetical protein